jgi:tetratricopeptide (TPR) repeat protein
LGVLWIGLIWSLLSAQQSASSTAKVRSLAERAQTEQKSGDFAGAERDYKAALALAPGFSELHMNLGLVYQLENRFSEAMGEFQRALSINPLLAGANFFLGVDYCRSGETSKAIPLLESAVREQPGSKEIWFWLATAQEIEGDTRAEVATLERALIRHPNDADLLYQLGGAHMQLGKDEVASLQKSTPTSFRVEQLLGESYASSSEWPLAVLHFQNAIQAAPAAAALHVGLGETYLRAGNSAEAIREFNAELQIAPYSVRAITRRGEAELISGDLHSSLRDLKQAADIDETQAERILGVRDSGFDDAAVEQLSDETRATLAKIVPDISSRSDSGAVLALRFIAAQQGEPVSAVAQSEAELQPTAGPYSPRCSGSELREALFEERYTRASACLSQGTDGELPAAVRIDAAGSLVQTGDYQLALKVLAALPQSVVHSADATYWRARCHEKLGAAAYLKLTQADPNSYRSHQVMADLASAKGDDAKAIEEYRAALEQKPSLPGLHYSLGHLLWKVLKIPEAREELEAELAINPRHGGALQDLGDSYLLEHDPEKALTYLQKALAIEPHNLDVHRDLGTAYSELDDFNKAEEEFKIALPGDHDGSIHYKLGRVYQSRGEKEKAAHEFAVSSMMNKESHEKLEEQTERLAEIEKSAQKP